MRVAILGGGGLGATTARVLLERRYEVVIVERDERVIDGLAGQLDCGFVHGDGTKPALLRELDPKRSDFLLCLTGNDQDNILASLVGRHLGFGRVVTKLESSEFDPMCAELGLEDTIVPDRTTARSLADIVAGHSVPEFTAIVKGNVRFLSFLLRDPSIETCADLDLPRQTRLIGVSRGEEFLLLGDEDRLEVGDELLVLTALPDLERLRERTGNANAARAKESESAS